MIMSSRAARFAPRTRGITEGIFSSQRIFLGGGPAPLRVWETVVPLMVGKGLFIIYSGWKFCSMSPGRVQAAGRCAWLGRRARGYPSTPKIVFGGQWRENGSTKGGGVFRIVLTPAHGIHTPARNGGGGASP